MLAAAAAAVVVTAAVAGAADAVACNVVMWGEHVVSKHSAQPRHRLATHRLATVYL